METRKQEAAARNQDKNPNPKGGAMSRSTCEPFCKLHLHCPACNGRQFRFYLRPGQPTAYYSTKTLRVCKRCGALFGSCYRGDSPVKTWAFDNAPHVDGRDRYFDLTFVGSTVERVHGWFNPETGYVTQVG